MRKTKREGEGEGDREKERERRAEGTELEFNVKGIWYCYHVY